MTAALVVGMWLAIAIGLGAGSGLITGRRGRDGRRSRRPAVPAAGQTPDIHHVRVVPAPTSTAASESPRLAAVSDPTERSA